MIVIDKNGKHVGIYSEEWAKGKRGKKISDNIYKLAYSYPVFIHKQYKVIVNPNGKGFKVDIISGAFTSTMYANTKSEMEQIIKYIGPNSVVITKEYEKPGIEKKASPAEKTMVLDVVKQEIEALKQAPKDEENYSSVEVFFDDTNNNGADINIGAVVIPQEANTGTIAHITSDNTTEEASAKGEKIPVVIPLKETKSNPVDSFYSRFHDNKTFLNQENKKEEKPKVIPAPIPVPVAQAPIITAAPDNALNKLLVEVKPVASIPEEPEINTEEPRNTKRLFDIINGAAVGVAGAAGISTIALNAEPSTEETVNADKPADEVKTQADLSEKYRYKFYLDANHYIMINDKKSAIHPHTWEIAIEIKNKIKGKIVMFVEVESAIKKVLEEYQMSCLNDIPPFNEINPTTENIGHYFKQKFAEVIGNEWEITELTISESANRSYII